MGETRPSVLHPSGGQPTSASVDHSYLQNKKSRQKAVERNLVLPVPRQFPFSEPIVVLTSAESMCVHFHPTTSVVCFVSSFPPLLFFRGSFRSRKLIFIFLIIFFCRPFSERLFFRRLLLLSGQLINGGENKLMQIQKCKFSLCAYNF